MPITFSENLKRNHQSTSKWNVGKHRAETNPGQDDIKKCSLIFKCTWTVSIGFTLLTIRSPWKPNENNEASPSVRTRENVNACPYIIE